VLVIATLAVVGLITMCAIVVDIAMLRSDLRADRGAADAAATAAALDLNGSATAPATACADAWDIALRNLNIDPTTATSPCSSFPAGSACVATTPVQATGTAADVTITITIPVINSSPLMAAQMVGGDQSQAVNTVDGTACQRVGVQIRRPRSSVFSGVAGISSTSTTVHSVARYNPVSTTGASIPALVALNPTACPSVDSASGTIHVFSTGNYPGAIANDSLATGAGCSSSKTYNAGGSGAIITDATAGGASGQLGYSAPSQSAAFPSSGTFTGNKVYEAPLTRRLVDSVYHCGNITPLPSGCTTGAGGSDAISNLQSQYGAMTAATAPSAGFTVFPAGAQSCASMPALFAAGNWFINCPNLFLGGAVTFTSGNVVFAGNISMGSGTVLTFNNANASTTAPIGNDSVVVVQGTTGISTSSNTWQLKWYRTTVFMTNSSCPTTIGNCGTLALQNGGGTWTAPQAGAAKGLIYWSETNKTISFQGNPALTWNGVFFSGSAPFDLQGNATVDASNVQLWVSTATLHNASAQLLLRPDPNTGISTLHAGTSLIR
jgi:hypothetical protein